MDGDLSAVVYGVVSNALWALICAAGKPLSDEVKSGFRLNDDVKGAIREAVDSFCGTPDHDGPVRASGWSQRLLHFLQSSEMELIVRQLFSISLVESAGKTVSDIRAEFLGSLSVRLDVAVERLPPAAMRLFESVVSAIAHVLETQVECRGLLSAHEALSTARYRVLLDEIASISRNMQSLTSVPRFDLSKVLAFETGYRGQFASVHRDIRPPNLDAARRVPLDELFVAPTISFRPRPGESQATLVALGPFLSQIHRIVVLGNPGGGKSTLSLKICYDLAVRHSDRLVGNRQLTPAIVVLREYAARNKECGCSILQYLEYQSQSRYQVEAPVGAFEYLLLSGRLFIVFDGLDELLDTSFRQQVSANVEAFCELYPTTPVLVTSRLVGYEQAPLDEQHFVLSELAPFDEQQVSEYAEKWFKRDYEYSIEARTLRAQAFVKESAIVEDLRSNPLMLGLMCNLYREDGYIPRNRPEVYSKCSVMLFEKWDKGRGIRVTLRFDEHIRTAMQDLAFWIYSDESLQGGVTEGDLIGRTTRYLQEWVFDDVHIARQAASEFVEFCTGRAWVFSDTGTQRQGDRLYQFTHRTFLEYFAACHLVSLHPRSEDLLQALLQRIEKREWDVLAQLAFQIHSKQVRGGADKLLEGLLQVSAGSETEDNLLTFAERTLQFLVPTPKVRRAIANRGMDRWIQLAAQWKGEGSIDAIAHVSNLVGVTQENQATVREAIVEFLIGAVDSSQEDRSVVAADAVLINDPPFGWLADSRVRQSKAGRLHELAEAHYVIACGLHGRLGVDTMPGLVRRFGIGSVMSWTRSPALVQVWSGPVGWSVICAAFGMGVTAEGQKSACESLANIAPDLLAAPMPWLVESEDSLEQRFSSGLTFYEAILNRQIAVSREIAVCADTDARFSLVCMLALDFERADKASMGRMLPLVEGVGPRFPELCAVVCRFHPHLLADGLSALEESGLNPEQRDFVRRWMTGETNLVLRGAGHPGKVGK